MKLDSGSRRPSPACPAHRDHVNEAENLAAISDGVGVLLAAWRLSSNAATRITVTGLESALDAYWDSF